MSSDLIKAIEDLLESGRGNKSELEHILMLLKSNRPLPRFDQKYLEIVLAKKSINYRGSNKYKSEGIVLTLSLIFGLFGFMGFGHRYVGHVGKSLAILYFGWAVILFNLLVFYPLVYPEVNAKFDQYGSTLPAFAGLSSLLQLDPQSSAIVSLAITISAPSGYFALYVWQIWDARKIVREFNQVMDQTGNPMYEMTIPKKVGFILVLLAPLITVMVLGLIIYLDSIFHFVRH